MKKTNVIRYGNRVLADKEIISNDTKITGLNNNDIIVGNSGSGKTGGYVIPNIQEIDSSLVVSDTKNQLYRNFKEELKEKGYRVVKLDLVHPEDSMGYNPLDYIRRYPDGSYREQDVLSLARTIQPILTRDDPFWDAAAANYIAFLIGLCLESEPRENQNMISVCELHRQFITKSDQMWFLSFIDSHPESFATKRYKEITSYKAADKTWGCIIAFANIALEPFGFREAKTMFANDKNFDIRDLGLNKTAVFLNTSDTDRAFDMITNVFYTQTLQVLCSEADDQRNGRLKVPVRIIMDDFASGARIPNFDKIISVIRSRDIYVSIIVQSLSQLESMYDRAVSKTIINNCDHILYLGSQDLETAQFIGSRAGKVPEAILSMPREKMYLIQAGAKARLVDKIVPYSTVERIKTKKVMETESGSQPDDEKEGIVNE